MSQVPGRRRASPGRPPTIATEEPAWRRPRHPTHPETTSGRRSTPTRPLREAEAFDPGEELAGEPAPGRQAGRIARSTAFFSIATAASRVAGLGREVVAAGYYGISGPMSAFTIAFQVPNLIRALFADAALQPAFVPVFTELLGKKHYREAFRLASTLLLLVTMVLGAITALFVLLAPVVMPIFAPGFEGRDPRPHGHPLPGPLPDPDPARDQRRRRRHPQQLRPLRRLRDLAAVLEPDDHPRPRRARAAVPRPEQDLRLRDRDPRRHPGPAADPGLGPAQHAVPLQLQLRLAPPGRAAGAAADAAGDDQPRPDQLQPADQQLLRQPRLRPGAGGDRQSLPHLPAAAGDLLGRDRDRPLPDPGPLRQPRRDRQPAGDDGQRDAPDPLRPAAGGGRDPRPLGPDDPARLPARRIRPGGDDAGRDGALLVRLLAADQRPLPAADAHLLQPPAALAGDRAWR